MSAELKAAVIGVGAMGYNHARVYDELKQTRLVGVADVMPETSARVGEVFGVPVYADYQDLLTREQPDIVTVAVPTHMHRAVTETVLSAGGARGLSRSLSLPLSRKDGRSSGRRANHSAS